MMNADRHYIHKGPDRLWTQSGLRAPAKTGVATNGSHTMQSQSRVVPGKTRYMFGLNLLVTLANPRLG